MKSSSSTVDDSSQNNVTLIKCKQTLSSLSTLSLSLRIALICDHSWVKIIWEEIWMLVNSNWQEIHPSIGKKKDGKEEINFSVLWKWSPHDDDDQSDQSVTENESWFTFKWYLILYFLGIVFNSINVQRFNTCRSLSLRQSSPLSHLSGVCCRPWWRWSMMIVIDPRTWLLLLLDIFADIPFSPQGLSFFFVPLNHSLCCLRSSSSSSSSPLNHCPLAQ